MRTALLPLIALLAAACASPGTPAAQPTAGDSQRSEGPKRVVVGMMSDPPTVNNHVNRASMTFVAAGAPELQLLISAGLAVEDDRGQLQPQLAEVVPSIDNGLWRVQPDGRMTTTWQVKPAAQWQDGTPFTSDDLVFTYGVVQDRDLEVFRNVAYESIDRVDAPDPRTVVVSWKQSYIYADTMFTAALALPLPKHLLERDYRERGRDILNDPYWSDEFVGTGPYRVRQFVRSSHILLQANDRYILGRPAIDEIEVKLIPDPNTLTANILAGAVELTLGRNVSLEEALQFRDKWAEGTVAISPASWIVIYPQFVNPSPPIVADVRMRRALLHAMDRQEMVDSLQGGFSAVAHSFLAAEEPEYRDVEASIVRYEHDPRRASQILEELGYTRGADGTLRDVSQQRLALEIRAIAGIEINQKAMFAVADFWQRAGAAVEPVVVPRARTSGREYTSTFPGFQVNRQGSSVSFLTNRVSSAAPLPENSFVGGNYARYMDPAFDALIERFFVTIPRPERMQILGQIIRQTTEGVQMLGLFYDGTPTLMGKRIANVTARQQGWNAHLWDRR